MAFHDRSVNTDFVECFHGLRHVEVAFADERFRKLWHWARYAPEVDVEETTTLFASCTGPLPRRLRIGPHEVGKEVVALVIDDDKGREVLDLDLPNSLHA